MSVQTQDPSTPDVGWGDGGQIDTGKAEGAIGDKIEGAHGITVTVDYKGINNPGDYASPSSENAPVFEFKVKNDSDMTVSQGMVIAQVSYGTDTTSNADIICGDGLFECTGNAPIAPAQSTTFTDGYTAPEGSDVRIEIQVYFDESSEAYADFTVTGSI